MFIALGTTFTVLPALMKIMPPQRRPRQDGSRPAIWRSWCPTGRCRYAATYPVDHDLPGDGARVLLSPDHGRFQSHQPARPRLPNRCRLSQYLLRSQRYLADDLDLAGDRDG